MAREDARDVWTEQPRMPDAGETVNGEAFPVPGGARTMAIHVPDLAGTGTTLKIQAQDPSDHATWRDVAVFDLTDGTTELLDGIPESQVTILPVSAVGSGLCRYVASADQSGAPTHIATVFTKA